VPIAWAWTGSDLFVWGGEHGQRDGALYDPATDSWTMLPALPSLPAQGPPSTMVIEPPTAAGATQTAPVTTTAVPDEPVDATAVWTGSAVMLLVWRDGGPTMDTWTYAPGDSGWTRGTAISPRSDARIGTVEAVTVAGTVYCWVAWSYVEAQTPNDTAIYSSIDGYGWTGSEWPSIDQRPKLESLGPLAVAGTNVVMGPAQMFTGGHSAPFSIMVGRLIDPASGRSTELPKAPGDYAMDGYQVAWTGGALLGFGSSTYTQDPDGTEHLPGAAAAWDPDADRWRKLTGSPLAFYGATGVWTGSELLVWGLMFPADQANTADPSYRAAGLQFAPPETGSG